MTIEKRALWPDGFTSAAMVSVDLDSEFIWISIDPTNVDRPKTRSLGTYGLLRGLPRLLDSLDEYGVKATFFVPGIVAETTPEKVLEVAERGHEIGLHGYRHENFGLMTPQEQEDAIKKGIAAIEKVTGARPLGFRLPEGNMTPETLGIMRDAGFLFDSSLCDSDLPYRVEFDGKPSEMVEIPIRWEMQDFPYFGYNTTPVFPPGGCRPATYSEALSIWMDNLLAYHDYGLCYVIKFDPQSIGTPGRIPLFDRMLHEIKSRQIWAATGSELAAYCKRM